MRPRPKVESPWPPTLFDPFNALVAPLFPNAWLLKLNPGVFVAPRMLFCVCVTMPEGVEVCEVFVSVTSWLNRLRLKRTESCRPNSMPNSSVLFRVIWASTTWIMTCGFSESNWLTNSMISSKNRGVALTINELLTFSGTTITSLSICWKGLTKPGVTCCTCFSLRR